MGLHVILFDLREHFVRRTYDTIYVFAAALHLVW